MYRYIIRSNKGAIRVYLWELFYRTYASAVE